MKKLLLILSVLSGFSAFAQTGLNYSGAVRDEEGIALPNAVIKLRFTIHEVTPTGTVIYQELNTALTDAKGSFSVALGESSDSFASIQWTGDKYLQVELDPTGGNDFSPVGTSQLPLYNAMASNTNGQN
jgi:hypothetical protein